MGSIDRRVLLNLSAFPLPCGWYGVVHEWMTLEHRIVLRDDGRVDLQTRHPGHGESLMETQSVG